MAVLTINRGLVTSPNELARPDGAAVVADNCVIDYDNTVEPRRGFEEFGNETDDASVVKQLLTYKGRILRHFSDKLSFDSDGNGTFLNFSGSYQELVNSLRIKYLEANSNLYFTTKEGIKKISATSANDFTEDANFITNAGGVKAVGLEAKIVPSASGFLPSQSKVAYKVLWARKDRNGNVVRGVPTSRYVVTNTSKDITTGESFRINITDAGAGNHKTFNSTTSIGVDETTITITNHGFIDGDEVKLYGDTPEEINKDLIYYIVNSTADTFQLAASEGGSAITLTALVGISNIYSGIKSEDFFTFTTPSNNFAVWFNISGDDNPPTDPVLFDKSLIEVPIYKSVNKNKSIYITKLAEALYSVSDISVKATINYVEVTNRDSGDVIDAESFVDVNFLTVSDIKNGQVTTGTACNVELEILVPNDIDSTDYFYEVYRTGYVTVDFGVTLNDLDPGEEFQKIAEFAVSETETIPTTITFLDEVPDTFRLSGAYLYVNPISGEGILQANEAPPIAHDIALFKNSVFYANTKERHKLQLSLLTSTQLVDGESKFYIGNSSALNEYVFKGKQQQTLFLPKKKSDTVGNSYYTLYSAQDRINYTIWFDKGSIIKEFDLSTISSDTITITDHGLTTNDSVTFSGILPVELQKDVTYYVIRVDDDNIKITSSANGSALTLTAGVGNCTITHSPKEPTLTNTLFIRFALENYENTIVDMIKVFSDSMFDILDFELGNILHDFDPTKIISDSSFNIESHNFENDDTVVLSGDLPPELSIDTTYYVVEKTENSFKLASTLGGVALSLTNVTGDEKSATIASNKMLVKNVDNGYSTYDEVNMTLFQSTVKSEWDDPSILVEGYGEDRDFQEVLISNLASQALSIEDTARSLVNVINSDPNAIVNAYYISSSIDLPGQILLEARNLLDDPFFVGFSSETATPIFEPPIPVISTLTEVTSDGSNNAIFTSTDASNFSVGQQVYVYAYDSVAGVILAGNQVISDISGNNIEFSGFSTNITDDLEIGVIYSSEVESDNLENPNRVYFSKIGQPEAVPSINYIDIGARDKVIHRILALRDSVIVLKEDGVYVISGSAAPNFSVRLSDSSALTYAPDTAANLNNLVYALTTQGVVGISETGVSVLSRSIENKIQEVANSKIDYKLKSWSIASESDRCYILFLPEKSTDNYATQAYRYNTFTRAWTRWTKPANCGIVNPSDDKIYLGDSSGRPYVLKERKNFERQDYADREIVRSIGSNAVNETTISLSSVVDLEIGDSFTQIQYVDINKFNRLLKKLDFDLGKADPDKYISLKAEIGDNLATKLENLRNKLLTDNIIVSAFPFSNDAEDLRDAFNSIVDVLNDPLTTATRFGDYKKALDVLTYESLITGVDPVKGTVTLKFITNFVQGNVSIFKAIKSVIQYAPQHFGKPEATKQVSEGSLIFDQNNFWGGEFSFASDRSLDFKGVTFSLKGPGYWDGYPWSNVVYGGEGNEVPMRTLVPRDKSKCRYLHVKFTHVNAREGFKLIGASVQPREISSRGYR